MSVNHSGAVNELLGIYICSILPAWSESILFQPEGGDKTFSQEERFCLAKKRGDGKRETAHDRPNTAEDDRKFPRKNIFRKKQKP